MTMGVTTADAGGASDQLRRRNLSTVLGLIHRYSTLSRTELAAYTGLNRSTIGDLVTELVGLGLVTEAASTGAPRVGRPSLQVSVGPSPVAFGINPEVDAIRVGLIGLGGRVLARVRIPCAEDHRPGTVIQLAAAAVAGMRTGLGPEVVIAGAGFSVPGQVRLSDGLVLEATHLGWSMEPLSAEFAAATGLRSFAANAAGLEMRAESLFGAGRDTADLVYITGGSSGIGGGAVTSGQLLVGTGGSAGEFGHTLVRSGGNHCYCGATGCLEAEVTQAPLLAAVGLTEDQQEKLDLRLAESSDPAVRALVEHDLELLGVAVRNAVNVLNPRVVILGGFLGALYAANPALAADRLLGEVIHSAREDVTVRRAEYGSQQLLVGAAELAFADLLADPAGAVSSWSQQ